ncbi:hypothetical protein HanIR_Chr17g0877841 [Helianthus annuus]|nr:hypothetical protein HanIR_Chr17g0877841 [Helianthus annuus]
MIVEKVNEQFFVCLASSHLPIWVVIPIQTRVFHLYIFHLYIFILISLKKRQQGLAPWWRSHGGATTVAGFFKRLGFQT